MTARIEPRWVPGTHVVLRSIWRGWTWFAFPAVVVRDSPDLIALWTPVGTRFKGALGADGRLARLPGPHMSHGDRTVSDAGCLRLARPGEAHDVWARWSPECGRFIGWKVNLQKPLRRSRFGFDTMDHLLDLMIMPDLRTWHWKDADELDQAVEEGLFSSELAQAVRAEGARTLEVALTRGWPYSDGWDRWSPSPDWTTPELPNGWDVP